MHEHHGEWWLPERPERRIPGTLTVSDDGSAELLVIGEFRSVFEEGETSTSEDGKTTQVTMTQAALEQAGTYPRVVGQVGNRYVTLEDCYRTRHDRNLMGGLATERLRCGHVFTGLGFEANEPAEFDGIAVELKWLSHWLQETSIEETHEFSEKEGPRSITLKASQLPARVLEMDFGTVTLGHGFGFKGDRIHERTLEQGHFFRIELPVLVAPENLADIASDLQDLVSIGVNLTAEFASVELLHPDSTIDLPSGSHRKGVEWTARWTARDSSGKTNITDYDMAFTFADFGDVDGIRRWLTVARDHRSALGRVMATRYSTSMYLSDRLLNRAAALEALDRIRTGSKNTVFATRLRRCAALAGEPFTELVGDVNAWVRTFKDDRDDIAHHYGRRSRRHTREQLFLADSAYWLFVMCMMRLAEAPTAAFDRLRNYRGLDWTRRGVAAALAELNA